MKQRAERFGRWDGRHSGYAEIKSDNIMVTNLATIMVTHARTDLGGRDRLQRNDGTEQIPLDELRRSARIQLGIFISVAHTGAEFVGKGYLAEHLCDRWVLRNGLMRKLSAKGLTFLRSLAGNINEIIIKYFILYREGG